jgi:aminoglycoside phosphotransferase
MSETQGRAIWDWYASGGLAVAANWLAARDVSTFNPGAAPPATEAKAIMVEHGRSTAESYLIEQLKARTGEFAKGVIGSPFYSLCDRLAGAAPAGVKVPQAALMHALKEAGWLDMGRIMSTELSSRKHVFAAPDMASRSKSELRRLVEDSPAPAMVRVK